MPKAFTEEEAKQRVLSVAEYILDHKATHQQAAEFFGLSSGYISKLMTVKLPEIDMEIAKEVAKTRDSHHIDKGGKKQNNWHVGFTDADVKAPKKKDIDFDSLPNFVPAAPPKQKREERGLTDITLEAFAELIAYLEVIQDKIRFGATLTKDETTLVLETAYAHLHGYKLLGMRYEER